MMLSACGSYSKSVANLKGHSETVIDGVVYLQFPSGVTVKYNKDGSVSTK